MDVCILLYNNNIYYYYNHNYDNNNNNNNIKSIHSSISTVAFHLLESELLVHVI